MAEEIEKIKEEIRNKKAEAQKQIADIRKSFQDSVKDMAHKPSSSRYWAEAAQASRDIAPLSSYIRKGAQEEENLLIEKVKIDTKKKERDIKFKTQKEKKTLDLSIAREIRKLKEEMLQEIENAQKITPKSGSGSSSVGWFNKGGFVDKVQGAIKGKDSVSAMLTPGEYVMKESVVRALGANFFENLNKWGRMAVRPLHFAEGGLVPGSSLPTSSSIQESSMRIDLNLNGRNFAMKSDPSTAKMLARELRKLKLTTA
jgi:hypothetical protein